jgi:hypothetical protein
MKPETFLIYYHLPVFNEFAYTASVNVLQKTAKEFKVQDIKASQ